MTVQINGLFPGKLLPTTTVAGCIDIFENAWPNPEEVIQLMDQECADPESPLNWRRAVTIGAERAYMRTNYDLGVSAYAVEGNGLSQSIHNQMYMLLLATTIDYANKHDIEALYHEPYNMLKYSTGQEYKAHCDGFTYSGRCVSAIVYLNDDYEGGEVEFVNFGIKIKPKAGMLLLFPSNYAYSHIAHPVTSGTKYAIVTWLKDRQL